MNLFTILPCRDCARCVGCRCADQRCNLECHDGPCMPLLQVPDGAAA